MVVVVLVILMSLFPAFGGETNFQVEFNFSEQEYSILRTDGVVGIQLRDGIVNGAIGDVAIPGRNYNIVCPSPFRVTDVDYSYSSVLIAEDVDIISITGNQPDLSDWETGMKIYKGNETPNPVKLIGDTGWRGNHIITVFVSPFLYILESRKLYFLKDIKVKFKFGGQVPVDIISPLQITRNGKEFTKRLAQSMLYNPELFEITSSVGTDLQAIAHPTLLPVEHTLPPCEGQYPLDYVIISPDQFADSLSTLLALELQAGYCGMIATLSEINSLYHGMDIEEKIRLFLQDAYRYWGIWGAIFAGDYHLLPLRVCGVIDPVHAVEQFPTFFYYLALDGDWNFDRDYLFGDSPEDDHLPPTYTHRRGGIRLDQSSGAPRVTT